MTFKKGDPLINRNGRPKKGSHNIPDILKKIGKETIKIESGDGPKRMTKLEALLRMVFREAVVGNQWAANFIADRTEGRPVQSIQGGIEPIKLDHQGNALDINKLPLPIRRAILEAMEAKGATVTASSASDTGGDSEEDDDNGAS